jgi:endonuclease III-like uncharacterized protein
MDIMSTIFVVTQSLVGNETLPNILDYIVNGGIAVIVFVIWWFTFRYMIRQHETIITNYEELVKETKREYQQLVKETKDDHAAVIEKFITVIRDQMKLNNYVSGILQRLEGKLDQVLKDK